MNDERRKILLFVYVYIEKFNDICTFNMKNRKNRIRNVKITIL